MLTFEDRPVRSRRAVTEIRQAIDKLEAASITLGLDGQSHFVGALTYRISSLEDFASDVEDSL